MSSTLPPPFKLERFFAQYEFDPSLVLMCCSDVESVSMREILDTADEECRALWDGLRLGYTESKGHPALLKEISELHGVSPDDVLVITPQEGIYIAMHCLVQCLKRKFQEESIHVITTFPAYQSLYENHKVLGCRLDHWTAKYVDQGWTFTMDDLNNLFREDTRILVVNFPHNPTGYVPDKAMWYNILQVCKDRNIFLFSDEMYRLTNNDGSEPLSSACAEVEDAISLFGMSKTLAMPGLRIGWLCSRNHDVMKAMEGFKDYITICSSAPSEVLALIGLRNRDVIVKRTVDICTNNLKLLENFFDKHQDIFEWKAPRACTTGFVKIKGWLLELGGGTATGVCERLRTDAKVLFVPASIYNYHQDEYVRVCFGRDNLNEGLRRMTDYIQMIRPSTV